MQLSSSHARFTSIFLATSLGFSSLAPASNALAANLHDAVKAALAESLESAGARLASQKARIDQSLAQTSDDAKVTLSASAGTRWQGRTSKTPASTSAVSREDALGAHVAYTLFDFGRQKARDEQARGNLQVRELALAEAEEKTTWAVIDAYLAVVAAERVVFASREQSQVAQTRLQEQKRNYAMGLRSESDVVTAEVDVGRAQLSEQSARDEARVARLRLARLVDPRGLGKGPGGAEGQEFIVAAQGVASAEPGVWAEHLAKLGPSQASASIRRLEQEQETARLELWAIRARQRPNLALTVGAQYASEGGDFTPMRPLAQAALAFTWDVPWNGQAQNEEAKVALAVQEVERQALGEVVARGDLIVVAERRLALARLNHRALESQSALVRKQRKLIEERYHGGKATALELSTVDAALASMQLERARLANTVAAGLADVAKARGRSDLAWIEQL